ncbi:hypothetical protein [Streptomyces sp. B93]|uniref:hypothetical protein n=1 Tax=Streptomyces sp. B93 TaxID=2824875 RepID=UPI001B394D94|nr:hypothetical protein [Streptomyces sp. B93]MBQ1089658.1 hypothetical protein [Streptomyces sp. B93]
MSPRVGGEADKLGNHYEGAWTVWQVLQVLAGRANSVMVEPLGDIGDGIEFTVRRHNVVEAHQVKRQHGNANYWTLGDLRAKGIFAAAQAHVDGGRQYHFVSTIPARSLDELAGRARRSPDLQTFVDTLTDTADFNYLSSTVYNSSQIAWETLRGIHVQCVDERLLRDWNAALAGMLLKGASGLTTAVTLGDLITEKLARPLDYQSICDYLPEYELSLAGIVGSQTLAQAIGNTFTSWKSSVKRELLNPPIERAEAVQIADQLINGDRCIFAVGVGGVGKSTVLYDVVERVESELWAVLAFRLDREDPFSSTYELGQRFNLGTSPVSALAAVAQERPCLLVIDQLDAVSKASGRMPRTFDAVDDLVREASAFPNMRVLLACRKFDFDHDDRIRTLAKTRDAKQVELKGLEDNQVVSAVDSMGVDSSRLSDGQKEVLRVPLHLKLLQSISDQSEAFSFSSTNDLFNAYWDRKRRDCQSRREASVRFNDVVAVLADEMSRRQRLTVPASCLDDEDLSNHADVLVSEHVLVQEGRKIWFFHESFFDYAFARRWTRRGQTLVEFLLDGEQELFRRAQVRQILTYLREEEPERFVNEMEALLSEAGVRFHVKDVALGVLRSLEMPTTAEWFMVERLLGKDLSFLGRIWLTLRTCPWFERLDEEGAIERWLRGSDKDQRVRALEIMLGGVKEHPDRLAQIIAPYAGQTDEYPSWLQWVIRFADVNESRDLFDLILEAVRRGDLDGNDTELFMSLYDLGSKQPDWAVELLKAYLVDRPGALALDSTGKVEVLSSRDSGAIQITTGAATGATQKFCEEMVPYLLKVMALTEYESENGQLLDRLSWYSGDEGNHHELGSALVAGAVGALRKFTAEDSSTARALLEKLAEDGHGTAQWLLYEALAVASEENAEYAATLLLDRESGLQATASLWPVQRLVKAIGPHLSDERFARLEGAILEFRPEWESEAGACSFALLSGLDQDRLSDAGQQRLEELRCLFNTDELTEPPRPRGGFIQSPISSEVARHMSDAQWLEAMEEYDSDQTDWTTQQGGAVQLSHVLKEEVKRDPARFSQLSSSLKKEHHPSYANAILQGLGDSDVSVDPSLVFEAVRHIASLEVEEVDRWLGWALRPHLRSEIPDNIIALLVKQALFSPDAGDVTDSAQEDGRDPWERGINTVRGAAVEMLGNILVHDADGRRTALLLPSLVQIAGDSSVAIRACAAHLVAACLRHAPDESVVAFRRLIDSEDRLLASHYVERLIFYISNRDVSIVHPVIRHMIASPVFKTRESGGRLAAYAGLELGVDDLLTEVRTSTDIAVRKGAAQMCAGRLPHTANVVAAGDALRQFLEDGEQEVREAAASMASALRGKALRPFERELISLINSPSFEHAASQILITLDQAPDRVDGLIMQCARRFVEAYGTDTGDISTRASADAREVGALLGRAYAQAHDSGGRASVLDLFDQLLLHGAYGVVDVVTAAERW